MKKPRVDTSKKIFYIRNPFTESLQFIELFNFYKADLEITDGGYTWCIRTKQQPKRIKKVSTDIIPNCVDGEIKAKGTIMTVVRNPFEIVVRIWLYISQKNSISFPDFVKMFCDKKPFPFSTPFPIALCKEFLFGQLFDRHGVCKPQIIIRGEYDIKAVDVLLEMWSFGKVGRFRQQHIGGEIDYKSYYTPELREMIEKKCSIELKAFGYTFDGAINTEPFVEIPKTLYNPITKEAKYVE